MAGSEAEERIRAVAEADLRRTKPDARIIHELVVHNCRLDLAAVTPDEIVLVEVKSERDVLDRMKAQIGSAWRVTRDVKIYAAPRWRKEMRRLTSYWDIDDARRTNEHRCDVISHSTVIIAGEAQEVIHTPPSYDLRVMVQPMHVWDLMWSAEMCAALTKIGLPTKRMNQFDLTRMAVEHMSGREIRRAVCAALRARAFPRADPAC